MMNQITIAILAAIIVGTTALPHVRVLRQAEEDDSTGVPSEIETALGLPSNSTSIRANIVDSFSCEGRSYGYYADVENECQVFHVCLPVKYAGGKEQTFKWSFICPSETIFNQESFTCARPEDAVSCEDAPSLYSLNENFGVTDKPVERVAPSASVGDLSARIAEPAKSEKETVTTTEANDQS